MTRDTRERVRWLWSCLARLLLVMVLDGPVLALSDIMHGIAAGSDTLVAPEDDIEKIISTESSTPEPLDNAQIELMRTRVLEIIVSGASKMNTSSREKELLEMVHLFLPV